MPLFVTLGLKIVWLGVGAGDLQEKRNLKPVETISNIASSSQAIDLPVLVSIGRIGLVVTDLGPDWLTYDGRS